MGGQGGSSVSDCSSGSGTSIGKTVEEEVVGVRCSPPEEQLTLVASQVFELDSGGEFTSESM